MTSESKSTTGSSAAVWDHQASSYDASRQTDLVYSSCIHQAAGKIPKGTGICLDAGCGTGLVTKVISSRCNAVVAVDYSLESLRILKSKGLQNVVAVQADLSSLPFKDSVFDGCLCANTLQHFKPNGAQELAVGELRRVTREISVLCVSVHHYSKSKRNAGWIKEGKPGQSGIDYIFRFTRNDLLKIIPGSLIRGVGYYELMRIPFFGSRLQNLLAGCLGRVAARLGYGHMLIAVANTRNPYMTTGVRAPNQALNRTRKTTRAG